MLLTAFRWYINPDATSYFTIAEKYAHGNIRQAISGYWGPLLSWLLVPSVWLHVDLDIATRLIDLSAGLGLMAVVYQFLRQRRVGRTITLTALVIMACWSLQWALTEAVTPDMLLTFLTVLFYVLLLRFMAQQSARLGAVLGVIAALMYFSKAFGLFLAVGVMGLVFLWQWLVAKQYGFRALCKQWVPVALALGILVLPFIGVISVKYHTLTINQAGSYNYRVLGPQIDRSDPQTVSGPWNPPNATAVSVWEEPITLIDAMPSWSPLASRPYLAHFVRTIGNNLNKSLTFFKDTNIVYSLGAIALIVGCFQKKRFQREYVVLTVVSLATVLGYSLVLTEFRYLWAGGVAALLGLALFVASAERARFLSGLQGTVVAVLFAVVTIASSVQVMADVHGTTIKYQQGLHAQIAPLSPHLPAGSRVISDSFYSIYQCYYLRLHCYSVISPPVTLAGQQAYYEQLKHEGITYLVDMHSRDLDTNLQSFKAKYYVQTYELPKLTVYELR